MDIRTHRATSEVAVPPRQLGCNATPISRFCEHQRTPVKGRKNLILVPGDEGERNVVHPQKGGNRVDHLTVEIDVEKCCVELCMECFNHIKRFCGMCNRPDDLGAKRT